MTYWFVTSWQRHSTGARHVAGRHRSLTPTRSESWAIAEVVAGGRAVRAGAPTPHQALRTALSLPRRAAPALSSPPAAVATRDTEPLIPASAERLGHEAAERIPFGPHWSVEVRVDDDATTYANSTGVRARSVHRTYLLTARPLDPSGRARAITIHGSDWATVVRDALVEHALRRNIGDPMSRPVPDEVVFRHQAARQLLSMIAHAAVQGGPSAPAWLRNEPTGRPFDDLGHRTEPGIVDTSWLWPTGTPRPGHAYFIDGRLVIGFGAFVVAPDSARIGCRDRYLVDEVAAANDVGADGVMHLRSRLAWWWSRSQALLPAELTGSWRLDLGALQLTPVRGGPPGAVDAPNVLVRGLVPLPDLTPPTHKDGS